MQFDLILTNPPFQDTTRRGKTPHKLWIDFTLRVFEDYLRVGGMLAQVSPSSYRSPNSVVLDLMRVNSTRLLRFDTGAYFPDVGSTFSDYQIEKTANDGKPTTLIQANDSALLVLDDDVLYLPNDLSPDGISIHRKVMFSKGPRLDVRWDYVTCHNIRLREANSTLSRTETSIHRFPVFHTNRQTWWSSIEQDFARLPKVMWTRSGYTLPFFDSGTLGGTDMAYYVVVADSTEGLNLAHNLNLGVMRYIFETAKWSGFGNERVFAGLPDLPRRYRLSDRSICELFGLSASEAAHIERRVGKS